MRVLLPTLPEPPDQVIQNLTLGSVFEPWQDYGVNWQGEKCLQGEWQTSRIPEFPVPRALVGWIAEFAQAPSIGPMAMQGGIVGMVPIGPAAPKPKQIDPAIAALCSQVSQDSNGELYGLGVMMPSQQAPEFDRVLTAVPMADPTPVLNPLREVKDSGLLKVLTAANLPQDFGRKIYETQQSYQVFTWTGVTRDSVGNPLGNCRVVAYQTGWQTVQDAPVIIAETMSDGSGNFSILLRNIDYQLTAYKPGSPDVAGITRNDVTPTAV